MSDHDRISNATDYEITAGRLCPFCGETRMIERINAGWLCAVCSRIWAALPGKYRGWRP